MARSFAARHHCDGHDFAIGVRISSSSPASARAALGRGRVLLVHQPRAIEVQREATLDVGLLRKQHATDVRVLDDSDLGRRRVLAGDRPALRAVAGVFERLEVAGVAERHRAQADADARLVHHVEHAGESAMRLADQVADRPRPAFRPESALAEIEQRVDGAAIAHLVIEPGERHVVALADRAIRRDEPARHDEQRDPLHARRPTRDLREHQVNDVLRRSRARRTRSTSCCPKSGSAARAEIRRPAPPAWRCRLSDEPAWGSDRHMVPVKRPSSIGRTKAVDLRRGTVRQQQVRVGRREQRVAGTADVGGKEIGEAGLVHHQRQLHAAIVVVGRGGEQACCRKGVEGGISPPGMRWTRSPSNLGSSTSLLRR